jgi:hypothetical protein
VADNRWSRLKPDDRLPAANYRFLIVIQLSFGLLFATVLTIKPFNATRGINEFLFAGKERMAIRANFKTNLRLD